MQDYLRAVLVPLLTVPESLVISESDDERGTLLSVRVAKQDMALVIGREGETVRAIRTLIHLAGVRKDKKVSVKVNEA